MGLGVRTTTTTVSAIAGLVVYVLIYLIQRYLTHQPVPSTAIAILTTVVTGAVGGVASHIALFRVPPNMQVVAKTADKTLLVRKGPDKALPTRKDIPESIRDHEPGAYDSGDGGEQSA